MARKDSEDKPRTRYFCRECFKTSWYSTIQKNDRCCPQCGSSNVISYYDRRTEKEEEDDDNAEDVNAAEWKKPHSPWKCASCGHVTWFSKLIEIDCGGGLTATVCPECESEDVFPNSKKDWDRATRRQQRERSARESSEAADYYDYD